MRCPYCGALGSKVISTSNEGGSSIRRRRKCKSCNARFTTHEQAAASLPMLIKHDGTREVFDRQKLIHGIELACAKRPIPTLTIQTLAEEIEQRLLHTGWDEVSSHEIGGMVLQGLREIDEVAYIRYALIYLQVSNVDGVLNEVDRLVTIAQ